MLSKGFKAEFKDSSVELAYNYDFNHYEFEFTTPYSKDETAEVALTNHRVAKCNIKNGNMVTSFNLSPEAYDNLKKLIVLVDTQD